MSRHASQPCVRFIAALLAAVLLAVGMNACVSRVPQKPAEQWQTDSVDIADSARISRPPVDPDTAATLERVGDAGDEGEPGLSDETRPEGAHAPGEGERPGGDEFVRDVVLAPGSGDEGDQTGDGPADTAAGAGAAGDTAAAGRAGLSPGAFDTTGTDTTLVRLDGPPVMRGFIPPGALPDSLLAEQVSPGVVPPPDTVGADTALAADTTVADTLAEQDRGEADLDTSIVYSADDIFFQVPERTTILTGNAAVEYKGMTLRAHRIEVNWNRDLMSATPTYDTTYTDTTNTEIDTILVVGVPTFSDGGQTLTGDLLKVNMKTREGYVEEGRTEFGIGFYRGEQIQKVSDDVLYVKDGYFTTSPDIPPDYKFTGDEMKMIVGDKVVGKPVVLRFGDVPVFALPFGVFSIKRGRRSGILIPSYGESSDQGRNLQDFGYYWAASDYWDLTTRLNFYEKTGIMLRSDVVYKYQDKFNGGIGGSIDNRNTGTTGWDLTVRHKHQLDPTTSINVDGTFVSRGNYYQDYSYNANRRLDQRIRSNATFSKRWPEAGNSLTMNLNHEQNLATDENSQTLPNISYNHGRIYFFPTEQQRKSEDKSLLYEPPEPRVRPGEAIEEDDDDEERWYNSISMSYSNRLQNQRDEELVPTDDGGQELDETWRSGLAHSINLSAPQKVMRYINVNPSISYDEDWFLERREWHLDANGRAYDTQERGFFQRRTFRASVNTTTKLYGYFPVNRWTVETVRHVMTPTVGFSFTPDFSDPEFGYYQFLERTVMDTVITEMEGGDLDTTVTPVTYSDMRDRYSGSIFGGTSRGRRLAANFSLNNLFQMKRLLLDDEGEEIESKLDLFTYNLSTSYNFAADSLKFGDLSASLRANPISGQNKIGPLERLSIDIQTRHSYYQYDVEANRRVDEFYWERDNMSGLNFLRLTSFSTSSSFGMSGANPFVHRPERRDEEPDTTGKLTDVDEIRDRINERFGDPSENINAGGGGNPWRLNGSIRYSLDMDNPLQPRENLYVDGSLTVQLTQRWRFTYSSRVDLMTKQVVSSNLYVYRDLKSWEGELRWSPQGIGQGFYLRIGIKAPMLQDVQVEQRRGRGAVSGF